MAASMTRQTRSNGVNNNKGIALLSLVALTALIPLIILLLLSLNTSQASHARYYNSADTVLKMKEIKNFLMNQSRILMMTAIRATRCRHRQYAAGWIVQCKGCLGT
jgi:hypothetical protein